MLIDESVVIKRLLDNVSGREVINVCSSDRTYFTEAQPHIYENVLSPLVERGCHVTNLDLKAGDGIDIVADCQNMPAVSTGIYDLALFCSAVEHIVSPRKALSEIRRILKPDGFLIASAPGRYPRHRDPIDTMLRIPDVLGWRRLLRQLFRVEQFHATSPRPAPAKYGARYGVFATIVMARPMGSSISG